jgi:hypothetical protein
VSFWALGDAMHSQYTRSDHGIADGVSADASTNVFSVDSAVGYSDNNGADHPSDDCVRHVTASCVHSNPCD